MHLPLMRMHLEGLLGQYFCKYTPASTLLQILTWTSCLNCILGELQALMAECRAHRSLTRTSSVQVDIIPEAGHYPFLDQPLVFLEKVLGQTLRAFPDWQPSQHAAQQ